MTNRALPVALLIAAVVLIVVALVVGGNGMWIALAGVALALAAAYLGSVGRKPRT